MLIIRSKQMEAFREGLMTRFVARMVAVLIEENPDETALMTDVGVERLVVAGIARAQGYGIEFEDDIRRFLGYLVRQGPTFDDDDRYPDVRALLREEDTDGEEKMDEIDDYFAEIAIGAPEWPVEPEAPEA